MKKSKFLKRISIVLAVTVILCISLVYSYHNHFFFDKSQQNLLPNNSITTRNINDISEYDNNSIASALQFTTYDITQTFVLDRLGEFYAISYSEADDNVLVEVLHAPCTVGVYLQERIGTAAWLTTATKHISEGDNYVFSMPSVSPFRLWAVPLSEADSRITLRIRSFNAANLE